jgi:hypothetical protein
VVFKPKEWFDDPSVYRIRRRAMNRKQKEELKTTLRNRVTLQGSHIDSDISQQIAAQIEKQDPPKDH